LRLSSNLFRYACLALLVAATAAAARTSDRPVKIGVLNDQSGIYADVGGPGSVEAARMAAEAFGGKVLGRDISILSGDHKNSVELGTQIAKHWFDDEGVAAIVDLTNSAVALAVQTLANDRNRITIVSSAGATELTGSACSPTGFNWGDVPLFVENRSAGVLSS
jgi:branched-chain amino acid transport system substrate-binding protein